MPKNPTCPNCRKGGFLNSTFIGKLHNEYFWICLRCGHQWQRPTTEEVDKPNQPD